MSRFFCLFMVPLLLLAEEEAPAPPLQSVTLFLLGTSLDPEVSVPDVIFQFEDHQGVNGVSMQPGGMAGPFLRHATPGFQLFREERVPPPPDSPPDTPPEVIRHPLARVDIPVEWRNVFLLVHVDSRSGTVQSLRPLNQSADVLPVGHLGLISFLDRSVTVRLGGANGDLAPGGRLLLPAERRTGPRGDMVLFLAGARNGNGEMEVLASRRISVNPDFRRLALLFPDAGGLLQIIVLPPAPEDLEEEESDE
ncbi:MAG: hypothetical protein JJU05_09390 [Verrucomicrobia bacterium]|nr:hypothetical protein [Verrucomicrobiota bacterium]MCH8526035.1 hypothetical protein [Kiritimatiellia bacterium]